MRSALLLPLLILHGAACDSGPARPQLSDAQLEQGRAERAFWSAYDAARDAARVGNDAEAERRYTEALELKRDHPTCLNALVGYARRGGRLAEALELARRLETVDRPRTRALLLQASIQSDAEALLGAGLADAPWFDLDAAAAAAAEAQGLNPEETGSHLAVARIALLRGDPEAALRALSSATTLHPQHVEARTLQVVAEWRRNGHRGYMDALAELFEAVKPKDDSVPQVSGDGDTRPTGTDGLDTPRRRAWLLATTLEYSTEAPATLQRDEWTGALPVPGKPGLRVIADFDGDGRDDELVARRASEEDALRWLFGRSSEFASFTLRIGAQDVTESSGLADVAACCGSLTAEDLDGDGDIDVVVFPGPGDPLRVEPPLVLVNEGGGGFRVHTAFPTPPRNEEGRVR